MATVTSAGSGHLRTGRTGSGISGGNGLGEFLRHARESRGLTLERIARETRIPQRHLEALEHGDLGQNPAGFYQRAEIRAYAQAVGLDTELALARLQSAVKSADTASPIRETTPRRTSTRSRTYALLALAVVVVAVAVAGRTFLQPAPGTQPAPVSAAAPVAPAPAVPPDTVATPDQSPPAAPSPVATEVDVQAAEIPVVETPVVAGAVTELVVTTEPAGARVTVNGIGWGVTPVTIPHMSAGDKIIRVSKEGYASEERALRLGAGQSQALDVQLNAVP